MRVRTTIAAASFLALCAAPGLAGAATYSVGPGQPLATLAEVPWESLEPGDLVEIHWQADPYREKIVLGRSGTAERPIVIRGVRGPGGERPVISGENATTPPALNFWNEPRGLIKVGGSNSPPDSLPSHLVVEGLHLTSVRPAYSFTNDQGATEAYASNAAAFYVEKAQHLVIRDNVLTDSGNGLFIGVNQGQTQDILVEGNHIFDNGIVGSIYEHNSYTAAIGITFQYNHYGPLRDGAGGNNLKDRSAGLVVRYNWIESGNRQLDLVDGEDDPSVVNDPRYRETFVYGNVLIEPDGAGNSQIIHYGGDSGTVADYRKGTLYLHHNTVISTRSGNTTLLRLSTNEENAQAVNNIVWAAAGGSRLAMLSSEGSLTLSHNWMSAGWTESHSPFNGSITDDGTGLGSAGEPGFVDLAGQDFTLTSTAEVLDAGGLLPAATLPDHAPLRQYLKHLGSAHRPDDGNPDLGAYEYCASDCDPPATDGGTPDAGTEDGGGIADGGGTADGGTADGGDAINPEAPGCDCSSEGRGTPGLGLLLLGLGLLARRRTPASRLGS
ncbi:MAG: MYXO-CTERM sorting domain-containing protein [Deltaproteobacteria bacterium]|nr:MYXO-CTERM sorting domain-containing protein [Deltaproteobacteria bacterium]